MTPIRICHYPRRDGPLPDGARWVGRPSRWGNPWVLDDPYYPRAMASRGRLGFPTRLDQHDLVALYRVEARSLLQVFPDWLEPLRTATALACACPLEQPCHVDVLLELLREHP